MGGWAGWRQPAMCVLPADELLAVQQSAGPAGKQAAPSCEEQAQQPPDRCGQPQPTLTPAATRSHTHSHHATDRYPQQKAAACGPLACRC